MATRPVMTIAVELGGFIKTAKAAPRPTPVVAPVPVRRPAPPKPQLQPHSRRGAWMRRALRWLLAVGIAAVVIGPPVVLFRAQYAHAKRFREVVPGRLYRSGQMTADGFRDAIERYKIKTVINLQHENPDPLLPDHWFGKPRILESEVCKQLGARYVLLTPDILPEPNDVTKEPPVVPEFLSILDDETAYPILLHCKAGLHRTGRLTAIYRMEKDGWPVGDALREMRAAGYGYGVASEADEFVIQFVQNYKPRGAKPQAASRPAASGDGQE